MNIEFTCANCKAGLKVLQTFAGKTIQCPKCTKKTPVPALSESAAPAPAAAPKPAPAVLPKPAAGDVKAPVMDGIYVSFACANCSAALKVLKSFAGKTIQCPKCAKKTFVPDPSSKDEKADPAAASQPAAPAPAAPAPTALAPAVPAPAAPAPVMAAPPPAPVAEPKAPPPPAAKAPAPAPAVKPAPAPAPVSIPVPASEPKPATAPAAPAEDLQPRLREQEQKLEAVMRQMRDMELRLDIEKRKAEKAEQEKQALASRKADDRLHMQEELSVHFKAEMDAARQTINRLEEKVRVATEQRLSTPGAGARTAAQIEKELLDSPDDATTEDETAVPDAVMAQIRDSRFGRYVRTSILIHVVVMAVTSVGLIRSYFIDPPPPPEEGAAGTNAVTAVSAPSETPAADAAVAPAAPAPAKPAEAAAPAAAKPEGVNPEAAKPEPAKPAEALPAPGEKPGDTQVDLGLR